MSGRIVHLLGAATIAAAASLLTAGSAFANCYSCGPSAVYQAPMLSYSAPAVYGYSYQAPVAYPAPVQYAPGCGCAAQSPMYVVNQGPAYNAPVVGEAEPIPAYEPGYRRAYPYYAGGHLRWHHRSWNRGYGYRGYGERGYGYRGYGERLGYRGYGERLGYRGYGMRGFERRGLRYRGFGQRHGMVMPGARYSMRHPMIDRGGIDRMHGMHRPMIGGMHHPMGGPGGMMHRGPQHAGGMRPGSVHPMGAPKQKMP
jgi:hypothetical protein